MAVLFTGAYNVTKFLETWTCDNTKETRLDNKIKLRD